MWECWEKFPDMERRCINTARVALGRVARREWWWAHNMINEAVESWTALNGRLVREGVRAADTILPDWLDASFTVLAESYSEEAERSAFIARLNTPPKNVHVATSNTSTRAALLAFAAF